ncbi:MAG: F0F1 ATP synthase subunit epsilon [Bifidobacteriaceae bacterium]|jgi:F-type H+-transporting ATPase subunit epsilon|nr:F0F1 ATP synthase subunit epsilon [Bifidobacteriaceae bacterium]MCI1979403.1 F0F1 ATP synthase subunit epsilon [Bifidobacteriaceae bacterium]
MSDSSTSFKVNLVAADRPVWSGEATYAVIPAQSGGMGILINHEPILTVVAKGEVRVKPTQGDDVYFEVNDGFAAFDSNKLTIAVEQCTKGEAK